LNEKQFFLALKKRFLCSFAAQMNKDMADIKGEAAPKRKNNMLLGEGNGTEWMTVADYRKQLEALGGAVTPQAIYYRINTKALTCKEQFGRKLVKEPKLKVGTRAYDLYFGTRTCP
jgi:hypothetical protein